MTPIKSLFPKYRNLNIFHLSYDKLQQYSNWFWIKLMLDNHGKRDNSRNLFSFSQSAGSADGHRFLGLSLLIGLNIKSNLAPLEGKALSFSLLWQLFYKDVLCIKYPKNQLIKKKLLYIHILVCVMKNTFTHCTFKNNQC